ncbi:MAG TPA: hypothetical protein VMJ74_13215 [Pseudomonadales bacterium]|nr:hypothetical protein [Pseudomonadales bacterium]
MVARARLAEYTDAQDGREPVAVLGNFEGFGDLDARTNAELLRPLHRGMNDEAVTYAKIDFYKVVRSGGALFAFAGLGMILGASAAVSRRRDLSVASGPH